MSTENGVKMQKAIAAVCRMQADVSKLLQEFDKLATWPFTSVFGNYATRDLTYNVRAEFWMPEGVYRYLHSKTRPGLVEAVTVCFVHRKLTEPVLLVARIQYQRDTDKIADCYGWDLWHLFFDWNDEWLSGIPKQCKLPDNKRIQSARAAYVPLYSVTTMEDVRGLLERVRVEAEQA